MRTKKYPQGGKVGDKTYTKAVNTFYDYKDQLKNAYDSTGSMLQGDNLWKALGYNPNKPETMGNVNEYYSAINNIKNRNQGVAATDTVSANAFGPGLYDLNPPAIKRFNQNPTNTGVGPLKRPYGGEVPKYPIGGLITAGISIVKGIFNKVHQKQAAHMQERYALKAENEAITEGQTGSTYATPFGTTFPYGGMAESPNVELEKEEVFRTPQGQIGQVDGPTHAQGGVPMNLEPGTEVYSDRVILSSGKTAAQEAEKIKKQIDKYKKILS